MGFFTNGTYYLLIRKDDSFHIFAFHIVVNVLYDKALDGSCESIFCGNLMFLEFAL